MVSMIHGTAPTNVREDAPQIILHAESGRGAAAAGIALADLNKSEGKYRFEFQPPSGVPIISSGFRSSNGQIWEHVYIEGPVELRGSIIPIQERSGL